MRLRDKLAEEFNETYPSECDANFTYAFQAGWEAAVEALKKYKTTLMIQRVHYTEESTVKMCKPTPSEWLDMLEADV